MPQTSDTEFYSLSLNALAPPPYSPRLEPPSSSDVESADEKHHQQRNRSFVRRLTDPFLAATSHHGDIPEITATRSTLGTRASKLVTDWWLWELLGWSMSALCILGIAVLLGRWDGRAVPDRWPLGITLNAYIAVLSGVVKYTLAVPVDAIISQTKWHHFITEPRPLIDFERFDNASRGPMAALALFVRTKGRTIASWGAIVAVFSLAMDPFFQQLVHLPKRPSNSTNGAVPRTVKFDIERNMWKNDTTNDLDTIGPDRVVEDVVFSYMVNNGTDPGIGAFCPSENCRWDPFDTLAMCTSCTDVSSQLTLDCLEESGEWRKNVSANDNNINKSFSCGWYLNSTSDNPVLMSGYTLDSSSMPSNPTEFLLMRNLNLQDVNIDKTYWDGSLNYKSHSFPLVDFVQVASASVAAILRNERPVARECSIRWCTERIAASYKEGVYTEQVLEEHFDAAEKFDALHFGEDMFFNYFKNISITPPDSVSTFSVSNDTILPIIFVFQDYFPAYLSTANAATTPSLRTRNLVGQAPRWWDYSTNPFSGATTGTEHIMNMTRALSNSIRMYPRTSEMIKGSGGMETFIKVRWWFFTIPVVLNCLALALLIVVMLDHKRYEGLGVWRSSTLASMYIGLPEAVRGSLQSPDDLSNMLAHCSRTKVRLQRGKDSKHYALLLDNE